MALERMPEQTVSCCQRCYTARSDALPEARAGLLALLGALGVLAALLIVRPAVAQSARITPARAMPAAAETSRQSDPPAATAVVTVTTTADDVNGSLASIPALLASPGPDGVSLREALLVGNAAPITTPVRVAFAIAGCPAECVILPTTPLPALARGAMTIDGTTQLRPDASPRIILDGYDLFDPPDGMIGLLITSGDNRVLALGIRNFFDRALALRGPDASDNVVQGSVLGSDGVTAPYPSSTIGVELSGGAHDNLLGGEGPGEGNTISGSLVSNVAIFGAETSENRLEGNLIGTTRAGIAPLVADNGSATARGVDVSGAAARTVIGGNTPGEGNTISGNATGVWLQGALTTTVSANIIGLDHTGAAPLPNADYGVLVIGGSRGTLIGGTLPSSRNVISSNGTGTNPLTDYGQGVAIQEAGTADTRVQGNIIGLDATGTQPRGNLRQGVLVADGAAGTLIGGEAAGAGNLIADNGRGGIRATVPVTISGNLIGFAIDGVAARGNQLSGVRLDGDDSLVGPGNRIGNSAQDGVAISGARGTVRGNVIVANSNAGVLASGNSPEISDNELRANRRTGVLLLGHSATVGDNTLAQNGSDGSDIMHVGVYISGTLSLVISNTISANAFAGITVAEGEGNQLSRNSISANGTTGIALVLGGNGQIAPPTLGRLARDRVEGRACVGCRVEIFSDDGGQGRVYEGFATADAAGNFVFQAVGALRGPFVTATSTDSGLNTSPFAPPVRLPSPAPDPTATSAPTTPTVSPVTPTPTSTPGPLPRRTFELVLPLVARP